MSALFSWRVWVAIAVTLFLAGTHWKAYHSGHSTGVLEQKAEDQVQFDKINADITKQKAEAAAILAKANAEILAGVAREADVKTQLEKTRETNRKATNDLANQLAGHRLQFAAQGPGSWGSGPGSGGAETKTTSDSGAATCIVSEAVDRSLKAIVLDADTLRDDYKLLYDWAHRDD
jgi:hypothetical protein